MSEPNTSSIDRVLDQPAVRDVGLQILDHTIWPILAVVMLVIGVFVPETFRNAGTIEIVLHGSVALGFLVLAEGVCLISGHFDLSIGAIAGFSAVLTGMVLSPLRWGLTSEPLVGILVILSVASLIGFVNGIMISKLGLNPFLQTLAFLIIFQGAKLALTTQTITGLPEGYTYIGGESKLAIGLMLVTFIAVSLLMRYTPFGQAVYALGSDQQSAREVGIDTDRMIVAVYTISGFLSGIAGLMLTGYTGAIEPGIANDVVFPAFAATVIGGVSLFGGRGKISGALGGVILLGMIQAALNISGTPVSQVQMVNGIVLLFAILLYNTRTNLRERILTSGVGQ